MGAAHGRSRIERRVGPWTTRFGARQIPRPLAHERGNNFTPGRFLRSNHRRELLSRLSGRWERIVPRAQKCPIGKIFLELFPGEQAVVVGVEHLHVSRALDEHVDDGAPAGTHVFLDRPEQIESSLSTEKHEQANGDDRIVRALDAPILKIRLNGVDRKPFPPCICIDALDRGRARFNRKNTVASSSRLQAEVAEPRAEIEDFAFEMLDCKSFERIERILALLHLPLELSLKEFHGLPTSHVGQGKPPAIQDDL